LPISIQESGNTSVRQVEVDSK